MALALLYCRLEVGRAGGPLPCCRAFCMYCRVSVTLAHVSRVFLTVVALPARRHVMTAWACVTREPAAAPPLRPPPVPLLTCL